LKSLCDQVEITSAQSLLQSIKSLKGLLECLIMMR